MPTADLFLSRPLKVSHCLVWTSILGHFPIFVWQCWGALLPSAELWKQRQVWVSLMQVFCGTLFCFSVTCGMKRRHDARKKKNIFYLLFVFDVEGMPLKLLFHPMLAATWNVKVTRCCKGIHREEDVTMGINLETIFIVTTLLFCMHILLSKWLLCCWVLSFLLEVVISCCCLYKHKGTPKGNSVVTQPRFYFFFFHLLPKR